MRKMMRLNQNEIGDNAPYQGNVEDDCYVVDGLFDDTFIHNFYEHIRNNINWQYNRLSYNKSTDRIWQDRVYDELGLQDVACYVHSFFKDYSVNPKTKTWEEGEHNERYDGGIEKRFACNYIYSRVLEHFNISEDSVFLRSQVVNSQARGMHSYPHTDSQNDNVWTLIYFANDYWEDWYGGNLDLYDRDAKLIKSITPKPGRIALFKSIIPHCGNAPSDDYLDSRYTLAQVFWYK